MHVFYVGRPPPSGRPSQRVQQRHGQGTEEVCRVQCGQVSREQVGVRQGEQGKVSGREVFGRVAGVGGEVQARREGSGVQGVGEGAGWD